MKILLGRGPDLSGILIFNREACIKIASVCLNYLIKSLCSWMIMERPGVESWSRFWVCLDAFNALDGCLQFSVEKQSADSTFFFFLLLMIGLLSSCKCYWGVWAHRRLLKDVSVRIKILQVMKSTRQKCEIKIQAVWLKDQLQGSNLSLMLSPFPWHSLAST